MEKETRALPLPPSRQSRDHWSARCHRRFRPPEIDRGPCVVALGPGPHLLSDRRACTLPRRRTMVLGLPHLWTRRASHHRPGSSCSKPKQDAARERIRRLTSEAFPVQSRSGTNRGWDRQTKPSGEVCRPGPPKTLPAKLTIDPLRGENPMRTNPFYHFLALPYWRRCVSPRHWTLALSPCRDFLGAHCRKPLPRLPQLAGRPLPAHSARSRHLGSARRDWRDVVRRLLVEAAHPVRGLSILAGTGGTTRGFRLS